MKLHQVLAVERSDKRRIYQDVTRLHHESQKTGPLSGISRSYTPKDDEGEQLPDESTLVQVKLSDLLDRVAELETELFDVTAQKDWANTQARADVIVDGQVLVENVPVTYLLFLEKQLSDVHTIVAKLPVLDPAEEWEYDSSVGVFRTPAKKTFKTKKVMRNHLKSPATDKHPAQVETYTEDVVIGTWETTKFSGALPQDRKDQLLERVEALQKAVKVAREQANTHQADEVRVGETLFEFILS